MTTKGISGFSSVFIEFCYGAACSVFTLSGFAGEFDLGIGFLSSWSSVWWFLPHDSWRHVNFEIQSLAWWFFNKQLKQSLWSITNYLRLETSLSKNSSQSNGLWFFLQVQQVTFLFGNILYCFLSSLVEDPEIAFIDFDKLSRTFWFFICFSFCLLFLISAAKAFVKGLRFF